MQSRAMRIWSLAGHIHGRVSQQCNGLLLQHKLAVAHSGTEQRTLNTRAISRSGNHRLTTYASFEAY